VVPDLTTELTLLGFDFGEQRIGVAIANTISRSARPLAIIRGKSRAQHLAQIAPLIETWQPQRLVVGLPLLTDEGEQLQTRDRKSTRLNSSHVSISYADFCLKKKKNRNR